MNVKHDFLLFEAKPCLRSPNRAVQGFSRLTTVHDYPTVEGVHRAMASRAFGAQFPILATRWLWWSRREGRKP